jgi:cobalt-precorrin-5B (C1)-methyltransferase
VVIRLPRGETPAFALARTALGDGWASASVIKDAGDDPDVTHGAEIIATVRRLPEGAGVEFRAGAGVGTVTLPGLPVPPGEPAINPGPRKMMREAIAEVAAACGAAPDAEIEISIPGGEEIARKTWNPRLGIVGGLSILGTTGIVVPFSCAAWIHSIHRGIDVARAAGLDHVAGATGNTSEEAARRRYDLPEIALLDMGDFAGGLLKYMRDHPVPRLTIAGGFAKLTKLAQGALDLHSSRSEVDRAFLAGLARQAGGSADLLEAISGANTAAEAFSHAQAAELPLAALVAERARSTAKAVLGNAAVAVNVLIVDRQGSTLAETGHG